MSKVAKVTALFWIIKICATTLGETGGDLLSMTLNVGYAASSAIFLALFFVSLAGQLSVRRYHPPLYWFVILTTLTAGTTISDFMDRTLRLGYMNGSVILVTLLAAVLFAWRITRGSLSVENISSKSAEVFYWLAILVSNTLGTALGDFLADDSGLGFFGGAVLIGSLLLIVIVIYMLTNVSRVALFWIAFILTRPFGATFGDLLTKTHEQGGLQLGTISSSVILILLCVSLVTFDSFQFYKRGARESATEGQQPDDTDDSAQGRAVLE
jgi:uncharacterized membrane-anchored protein